MVQQPCSCNYKYGGVTVYKQEFAPWIYEILQVVMPMRGIDEQGWPNSCKLSFYAGGQQAVGLHADNERLFQGACADAKIISLSLGSTRTFEIEANCAESDGECKKKTIDLQDGDLITMEGMCQKQIRHRIAKDDSTEERINSINI
jgi:alkylated DNA repair dioxygenase AlkB